MVGQKMASLKSLLLRAWRERWTDMQWSVSIKPHISNTTPEDAQQLADMMLQQALVGSTPNMLILSYFKHTVCSQIISLVSAIQAIVKFTDVGKPYCIKSLLEVMDPLVHTFSCRGISEDGLKLSQAGLSLLRWILDIITKFIQKMSENKMEAEYCTLLERATCLLDGLITPDSHRALLYISKHDDADLYNHMEETETRVWRLLGHMQNSPIDAAVQSKLHDALDKIPGLQNFSMAPQPNIDVSFHPLNLSINVVTGLEAVLNPTNDIAVLVEQLLEIERSQGLSRPSVYCELLRTCMMGMSDAAGGTDELKWASFTYLKLPNILTALLKLQSKDAASEELIQGINQLLNYVPLLDTTDSKCHCDCLSYLMHEFFSKHNLITEEVFQAIMARRRKESLRQAAQEPTNQQPSACLILRAEPTLYSILKTLDTDYSKNQEPLRGVLSQMMSGKSLELILAAAAARGKVHSFAMKIVKFNELSKHATGEGTNAAQTRSTIFDISFLMLCHISQLYGLQMVTSSPEGSASFFSQWATCSLPEDGRYKSLDLLPMPESNKIESLLHQINPGGELRLSLTRWHEVCLNIPFTVQEVLYAWEHGALTSDNVQQILENLKCRMCCLPVIVGTWLCSFIKISDEAARQKPIQMLKWLINPTTPDTSTKSNLMLTIIRHMVSEILPTSTGSSHRSIYTLPPHTPILTVLNGKLADICKRGCMDIPAIHQMEYLLNVGGTLWFCTNLVKEMLRHDRIENINRGVSLVYSLFHLDLDALTLDLIHHVLPRFLLLPDSHLEQLMDPRGRAMARLAVMCLSVCHRVQVLTQKEGTTPTKRGKKRSRTELELEEPDVCGEESRAQKLRRLSSICDDLLPTNFGSDSFNVSNMVSSKEDGEFEPTYDTKDPLNKALSNLFRLFQMILSQKTISPRTGFVSAFVEETLKSGTVTTRYILQFMPNVMVPQLIKGMGQEYCMEVLLNMCDLSTISGRRMGAKVICQHAKTCTENKPMIS